MLWQLQATASPSVSIEGKVFWEPTGNPTFLGIEIWLRERHQNCLPLACFKLTYSERIHSSPTPSPSLSYSDLNFHNLGSHLHAYAKKPKEKQEMAIPVSLEPDEKPPREARCEAGRPACCQQFTRKSPRPAEASGSLYFMALPLSPSLSLSPENPLKEARKALWQHPQATATAECRRLYICQGSVRKNRVGGFVLAVSWNLKKEQRETPL